MNFYIRKNSLLPYLVLEFTEPVSQSETKKFYERLQNSTISFSMSEKNTCIPHIQYGVCQLCQIESCTDCLEKFVIVYKWQSGDTDKKGEFDGQIEIIFNDNGENFIMPIKSKLLIKIE